jgi:putative endonuclease
MNGPLRALLGRLLGDRGERAAARYLRRKGLRVITRGYRGPSGEIDLVAREGDRLVFVEVKTRRRGQPAEAVNPAKQRKLTLTALDFLKRFDLLDVPFRFDIVAIVWPDDRGRPQIEHLVNAFEAVGKWQMYR